MFYKMFDIVKNNKLLAIYMALIGDVACFYTNLD